MTHLRSLLIAALAFGATHINAYEIAVTTSEGDEYYLDASPDETLSSVIEMVGECGRRIHEERVIIEFAHGEEPQLKAYLCSKAPPRNYYAPLSSQEKKDLTYILRTLSNNSLAKITKEKSSLKKAGDRIDNLHPFKFIEAIFTDEELKVCARNLEGRSWVWSEFRDGLTSSLAKESAVDNLKPEYIQSMADVIHVDVNAILPTIQSKNWNKLVSDLIALVPRSGDSGRYNQ